MVHGSFVLFLENLKSSSGEVEGGSGRCGEEVGSKYENILSDILKELHFQRKNSYLCTKCFDHTPCPRPTTTPFYRGFF